MLIQDCLKMSSNVCILHKTTYEYERPIYLGPHMIRLRPTPHTRTPVLSYSLTVEPSDHTLHWQQDPIGNHLARVTFPHQLPKLEVTVEMVLDMTAINPLDFFLEDFAANVPFAYPNRTHRDLFPLLEITETGSEFQTFLSQLPRPQGQSSLDWISEMNRQVQQHIGYTVRLEPGVQSCTETLQKGTGSCRDSAWLLIQAFRKFGYAARFVSGYLVQLKADDISSRDFNTPMRDLTALHAWAEVYLPGAGWVGLDPTSGLFAGEGHIPLACSSDPQSAAPIDGKAEVCDVKFSYQNQLSRVP